MGAQAAALARAVDYDFAGTVEFVMGEDRRFYFLEMNTRLQVEHPVTELITGIDLVEQMIRSAAGEPLRLRQDDVRFDGWALEARLYAEDPYRDFLPSIGRLDRYRMPAEAGNGADRVRIDAGVVEGSEISLFFDPLIAKLVTHGPDRDAAVDTMANALDCVMIDGIAHNQPFLSALMDHPRWRAGRLSTGFIAEEFPDGFGAAVPDPGVRDRLAIVALAMALAGRARLRSLPGRLNGEREAMRDDWIVRIDRERIGLRCLAREPGSAFDVLIEGAAAPLRVVSDWRPGDPLWSGTVGGVPMTVQVRPCDRRRASRLARRRRASPGDDTRGLPNSTR